MYGHGFPENQIDEQHINQHKFDPQQEDYCPPDNEFQENCGEKLCNSVVSSIEPSSWPITDNINGFILVSGENLPQNLSAYINNIPLKRGSMVENSYKFFLPPIAEIYGLKGVDIVDKQHGNVGFMINFYGYNNIPIPLAENLSDQFVYTTEVLERNNELTVVRLFQSESPFYLHNLSENNVVEFAQSNPIQWHNVDKLNRNLLHLAALLDWKKFAKLLIDHGVNINATDKYHCTPLHLAVFKGNYEMVSLFMKHPLIYTEIPDMDGLTPVDLANMWDEQRILSHFLCHQSTELLC